MTISDKNVSSSRSAWKRVRFLVIFVIVYSILTLLFSLISFSSGMAEFDALEHGKEFRSSISVAIIYWLAKILMFPVNFIHRTFFLGRPLPIGDWFWLILNGLLYGLFTMAALQGFESYKRRMHG